RVMHDGSGLFAGCPQPLVAARYHSLGVVPGTLPESLRMTAWLEDEDGMPADARMPMALVASNGAPTVSVQFHPESYLTPDGPLVLRNFLAMRVPGVPAAARVPAAAVAP
ncbi:MAG: anthranilate/aminodeoxychorismate synthase component II, partial [Planctomycetota bacterium]